MGVRVTDRRTQAAVRSIPWLDPCSFLVQVGLVGGLELSDEAFHAFHGQNDIHTALANATQVMRLESTLGLWVEPALQAWFLHPIHVIGTTLGASEFVPLFNAIYGLGHVCVTFCFALWVFLWRRPLFAFLRNVFLITTALSVVLNEIVPLAPPRLATGLLFHGHPFRFVDTVFGQGGGVKLGFNEYAAFPSLHVAWALMVGLALVWLARSPLVRVLGGLYPLLMLTTVIVTGNHYIVDGLASLLVISVALALAVFLEYRHANDASLGQSLRRLYQARHADDAMRRDIPVAAGMARRPAA